MGLHSALTPQDCLTRHGLLHLRSKQALSYGHSSSRKHSGRGVEGSEGLDVGGGTEEENDGRCEER